MRKEDLKYIGIEDEITFTSIPHGTEKKALVIGTTDNAALIKSDDLTIAVQPHRIVQVKRGATVIYPVDETRDAYDVDDVEEPYEETLPAQGLEETGDYSENVRQSKMEFPHFQEVEGKKKVTLFTLELNTGDMRHTVNVQFADLKTTLNAHDTLRLIEWLSSHKSEVALLSRLLNEAAMSADQADMQRISYEWQQYKHTDARGLGDETGPMTPRQSDQG